ncbi:DUF438 domain-containing protein [Desulfurococcus amylolyticus]
MKNLIKQLHQGVDVKELKEKYRYEFSQVSPI